MKGTRKFFSILTALALCLSLLPGTAWAVDAEGPGVSINNSPLVNGKQYVAGESGVVEKPSDTPSGTPYLDYNNDTLTVHGQMDLKSSYFRITGNVTITGGEGSCLEAGDTDLKGTLKLSGSVDFKPQSLTGNSSASPVSKLTTTSDYSGDIAIQGRSMDVLLDVQSSASIAMYVVNCSNLNNMSNDPMTLKSAGDINFTNMLTYHTVTIEGKNVSFKSPDPAFWGNSLTIQAEQDVTIESTNASATSNIGVVTAVVTAGGNVTISSCNIPVASDATGSSLTVKGAQSVSITGKTDASNSYIAQLLTVPVTFENCGSVTVEDTGTGEILKEGVTVTSDCPWAAKTGNKTVTMPSGSWNYGGDVPEDGLGIDPGYNPVTVPTCWKAGEGWAFYEPPAGGEGSPAKLTLDNATYEGIIGINVGAPVSVVAKGENRVGGVIVFGSVTVDETNGTLNTLIAATDVDAQGVNYVVYGKAELPDGIFVGEVLDPDSGSIVTVSLTVRPGAELTIPSNANLSIFDTTYLTNNGTIVNNGTVTLKDTAAESADAETVKSLGLTGSGSVTVEKETPDGDPVTETYTNSGTKLLDPAGTLNLSSKTTGEDKLADKGYKWEVLETDPNNTSTVTKAKLTLALGFNATSVTLPDAAVEIVTEGESSIGTLAFQNNSSKFVDLTFSGTGPLTVQEQINIASGDNNTLTVNQNANVIANGGIYIGETGGVNSLITVNGTLTAKADSGSVISAGSVAIGKTGVLKISGESGVVLGGMPKNTDAKFNSVFTIADGGCFTANCSTCNLRASTTNSTEFPANAGDAFVIPKDFLPEGCEPKLNGNNIDLWNTKINDVYSGALTIHKYHTWSSAWMADDDNGHYHACTFEGCTAKNDERPHYYAHGSTACRDCGHTRPAGTPDSDSGSSGGSSGSDRDSSYTVTVEKTEHGKVASDRRTASRGDTVTLTVTPDSGYALNTLTVTDSRGNEIALTEKGSGAYTFTMPSRAVTVRAVFLPLPDDTNKPCDGGADCPSRAFSDLNTSKWYHYAVDYVLRNNLMCGYGGGRFGPDNNLTRAQFTQILYNKEGRPVVNYLLQYNDVADGAWYTEAVRWATSQGIVGGYGNGMFGPNDNITREQLAVMLWRYAGSPAATDGRLAFADADAVSEYALEALCWAVENGMVTGRHGGVLDPRSQATRAEAAAMLMRYLGR